MPMHDWARVDDGTFHHFHTAWGMALADALNAGVLPADFYALVDQNADRGRPDLIALQAPGGRAGGGTGLQLAPVTPPKAWHTSAASSYTGRRRTVTVRHVSGDEVVALVEIVSPGNKSSRHAITAIVDEVVTAVSRGLHVQLVDPFPPGPRDPEGLHPLVWQSFHAEGFALPPDRPLTAVSYAAGPVETAYVEPFAVGRAVPDLPLFLTPDAYVTAPLEASYTTAFGRLPAQVRGRLTP